LSNNHQDFQISEGLPTTPAMTFLRKIAGLDIGWNQDRRSMLTGYLEA
jgi:hypothetical protein